MGRLRPGQPLLAVRPFRSPHHTISDAGLVGGGSTPAPGEISLSHNGVLFLDELPEFNRRTLEVLRQPLEDGTVTISRALNSTTFPANFMLIAALNPCPCGYRGDARRNCHCTPPQIERYMSQDFRPAAGSHRHAHRGAGGAVPRAFRRASRARPARQMREQVKLARRAQAARFDGTATRHNAHMSHRQTRQFCRLDDECRNLLKAAMTELGLSARAHDKVLRVARTIADLDASDAIRPQSPERGDQLPDVGPAVVDVRRGIRDWRLRIGDHHARRLRPAGMADYAERIAGGSEKAAPQHSTTSCVPVSTPTFV